jgi:hypothetical protein
MSHNLSFVRDDAAGVDVLGSSGTPQALAVADTYYAQTGFSDVRDYRQASWYVTVAAIGTATKITVKIEWSEATNLAQQGAEAVSAGTVTVSSAEFEFAVSGTGTIPVLPLPVIAPNVKISVKADIGTTTTCYARLARQA